MQIFIGTVLVGLLIGFLVFSYHRFEKIYRINLLNKDREQGDLNAFISHFEDNNINQEMIVFTIEQFNHLLRNPNFIPTKEDKFNEDYLFGNNTNKWVFYVVSQVNKNFRLKGFSKETWNNHQTKQGAINTFDALFSFIKTVH